MYDEKQDMYFVGEVSDPFCDPRITQGLIEFYVRPTRQASISSGEAAELIDDAGQSHGVVIRGIGRITPDPTSKKWRPGDFLIRVEGISMDQSVNMRQVMQFHQK